MTFRASLPLKRPYLISWIAWIACIRSRPGPGQVPALGGYTDLDSTTRKAQLSPLTRQRYAAASSVVFSAIPPTFPAQNHFSDQVFQWFRTRTLRLEACVRSLTVERILSRSRVCRQTKTAAERGLAESGVLTGRPEALYTRSAGFKRRSAGRRFRCCS